MLCVVQFNKQIVLIDLCLLPLTLLSALQPPVWLEADRLQPPLP